MGDWTDSYSRALACGIEVLAGARRQIAALRGVAPRPFQPAVTYNLQDEIRCRYRRVTNPEFRSRFPPVAEGAKTRRSLVTGKPRRPAASDLR